MRTTAFMYGLVRGFMLWNLFLAAVPAVLALALFARRTKRGVAWWSLLGAWLLFLPNAPYVLTDIAHMVDDVGDAPTRVHAYEVLLTYGVFFGVGVVSYVVSLQLFRRFLHRVWPRRAVAPTLIAVHGLCVVGMYLGRFVRLNSWDAVVAPRQVLATLLTVPRPFTAAMLAVMFVAVGAAAYVTKAVGDKVLAQVARLR